MKTLAALAGAGLLLAGTALHAQEAQGPGAPVPAPAPAPAPAAADHEFTDAEIESFAEAAVEIQELRGNATLDDAAKQQQAATIVADAGIDAETYNAIGAAMKTDPEVAQRVQLALANAAGQPGV